MAEMVAMVVMGVMVDKARKDRLEDKARKDHQEAKDQQVDKGLKDQQVDKAQQVDRDPQDHQIHREGDAQKHHHLLYIVQTAEGNHHQPHQERLLLIH